MKPIHVLLLSLCVAAVVYYTILPIYRYVQARSWPAVPCEIVGSSIVECGDNDVTYYLVNVQYHYAFQHKPFESTRYSIPNPAMRCGTRGQAEQWVSAFPSGSTKVCFVNPSEPSFAVLNRDWSRDYLTGVGLAILIVVGMLFLRLSPGNSST